MIKVSFFVEITFMSAYEANHHSVGPYLGPDLISGSQTDPCFQNKNSGWRLTGRVCKKMCNHSSWAMPLSIAYHFTWLFHIVSIAIKKHKPCWISYFRCQWPFLFPHLCKELIPCHPVVTKCHLALNCFLFKDLLKDPM